MPDSLGGNPTITWLKYSFSVVLLLTAGSLVVDPDFLERGYKAVSWLDISILATSTVISGIVTVSVKSAVLNTAAVALARVTGIVSVFGLILLIAAGTIGGDFNLSSSNFGIAVLLAIQSLLGLSALLWPHPTWPANGD
ncbi:hypothetical protein [Aliamphritea ceti]|uniref:hypothetical protein n=1 Tax=Aliamphritea ceti TaxID=1524258 RepID=UPI0021C46D4A|nr:hypothetical protein [Aliamphritea ceti]